MRNKIKAARIARLKLIKEEYSYLMTGLLQDIPYKTDVLKDLSKDAYNIFLKKYTQIKEILEKHRDSIDNLIRKYATERRFENLNPLDIAILRIAIAEGFLGKITPVKAAINEAVRVAKRYGTQHSYRFINGVLGSILRKEEEFKSLVK